MITDPAIRATQHAAFDALREQGVELYWDNETGEQNWDEPDDAPEDKPEVWRPVLNRVQKRRIRFAARKKSRLTRIGRRRRTGGVK